MLTVTALGIRLFRPTMITGYPTAICLFFLFLFVFVCLFVCFFYCHLFVLLIQDADGKNDVSKKSRINLVKYPDNLNQKGESDNWFIL